MHKPQAITALVNAVGMAHAKLGETVQVGDNLNEALEIAPDGSVIVRVGLEHFRSLLEN